MSRELDADQLRKTFDPREIGVSSTEGLDPLEGIIGQERAVAALKFGLGIEATGFNIFVAGPPGIGKMTAVHAFLQERARQRETPPDWCYLNNFEDPSRPRACRLPPGRGRELQQDLKDLIEYFQKEIPKRLESEEHAGRKEAVSKEVEEKKSRVLEHLKAMAAEAGFALQATALGVAIIPVVNGHPAHESEFNELSSDRQENIKERREALADGLKEAMKPIRELEHSVEQRLLDLDREAVLSILTRPIQELTKRYQDIPDVATFPQEVEKDILQNLEVFQGSDPPEAPSVPESSPAAARWAQDLVFRKYRVNLLVDNSRCDGAPVIVELNPTYQHLFGRLEKEAQFGFTHTDFTLIKPGALHRANGGYLVVPIDDVLRSPMAWDGLKRALRAGEIEIESLAERIELVSIKSIRPQPIPLRTKVIVVGRPLLYQLLDTNDEDFRGLFKVKADFDTRMPLNAGNARNLCRFARTLCEKEHLRHLDAGALARLLALALRLAEDQRALSTHFGALADVIREAHYWAGKGGATIVSTEHIQRALDEKVHRSNLVEEHTREMLERGLLLIQVRADAVGQVNGLSVACVGDYAFGRPSRITASVGPGMEGILDIEREVELSGPIHDKGVLILGGYLLQRYGHQFPLAMTARLSFEQSYSEIEGDSASAAELFALLSELSQLPIRQGIAVTGSINQRGEVQAIGGVNQKIEGFFQVCCMAGLTGDQGVMLPESNVQNLMLREEVVAAVAAGRFHLWPIRTVDEGIALLTGTEAGTRDEDGEFPAGSVNGRVEQRLFEFTQILSQLGRSTPGRLRRKALRFSAS